MKYTNNVGAKLRNMGFQFDYTHKDEQIEYDVYFFIIGKWSGNKLEATVDITNKKVSFHLDLEKNVNLHSERDVRKLIKALSINKK